ncbi:tetratricopeptide repeat protein [Patescibacteria group bacterium]|nr:tetratricopeptide repeat protein [Patescibacteria group bacterium]
MIETQEVKSYSDSNSSKTPKKDTTSFVILLGLVLLLPIFFVPFPSFSFLFSKGIFLSLSVIILALLWIVSRLKDGTFTSSREPLLIVGISIPFVYLLSSLFSGSVMTSLVGQGFEVGTFVSISLLFLLMFLTTSILKTKERVYYTFFLFFISFFIISALQLLRLFVGPEFMSFGVLNDLTSNFIGKWNELSIFYGLTALLSLVTIEFIDHSKLIKTLSFIILTLSLFFIALVNFTTVWVVIGIFAFILVSFIISSNKFSTKTPAGLKSKKFPTISLVVVFMTLLFIIGGNNIGGQLSNHFGISNTEVRPSVQGTWDVAQGTLKTKQAFLGAGPNKFVSQWLVYKPLGVNSTIFWNTDFNTGVSFLLTSLITVGLVGFLFWVIFLGILFYKGFRSLFAHTENRVDAYLLPLAYFATVYLWIFSIIYVPTNAIMALTFIFTGVLVSLMIQNGVVKTKRVSFKDNQRADFILVFVLIFLVLVSVVTAYGITQKFIASAYTQKGLLELNKEGAVLSETENNIIKAINLSGNDSYYRFLSEINLINLQGLLSKEDLSEEELRTQFQSLLEQAIQNARKATEVDKTNYQNWVSLGRVYETVILFGVEGAYNEAMDSYVKAVNLSPLNPLLMLNLGVLEYNNKNYESAMLVLERSVMMKPDYSDAKYYLGLTYYNLGRVTDAIPQFEDLVQLNPESKEVAAVLANLKGGKEPFAGFQGVQDQAVAPVEDEMEAVIE